MMTITEMNARIRELSNKLEMLPPCSDEWDAVYKEYTSLCALQQQRYKEENEGKLHDYFLKNISGKSMDTLDSAHWDFYSDWHKDVYGYRPRFVEMAVGQL